MQGRDAEPAEPPSNGSTDAPVRDRHSATVSARERLFGTQGTSAQGQSQPRRAVTDSQHTREQHEVERS